MVTSGRDAALDGSRASGRGHRGPALLTAARELFVSRGYARTTMEQVARRAGLSKRSVYLYFANKDDLFIAVASEGIGILQRMLERLDVEGEPVEALIEETMETYLRFSIEHPDYFRLIFRDATTDMMSRAAPEVRQRVAEQERACLAVVERIVERGVAEGVIPPVNPLDTAVIFWGTCTGIILLSLGGSQTVATGEKREALMSAAVKLLFAGLRSSGETAPGRSEQ